MTQLQLFFRIEKYNFLDYQINNRLKKEYILKFQKLAIKCFGFKVGTCFLVEVKEIFWFSFIEFDLTFVFAQTFAGKTNNDDFNRNMTRGQIRNTEKKRK